LPQPTKDNTSSNEADDKPELTAVTAEVIHGLTELSCSNQYTRKHDVTPKESESPHTLKESRTWDITNLYS